MTKQMILDALRHIATNLYNVHEPEVVATELLTAEEVELISIADVAADQQTWKVINGLTEWINNHY